MTETKTRCGFCAFIGRTNVGKSTLINALAETKINITSSRPQTTHLPVRAILTEGDTQLVLSDTPGLHRPQDAFGQLLLRRAGQTAGGADLLIAVVEPGDRADGGTRYLLDWLTRWDIPTLLVINKVDRIHQGSTKVRETADALGELAKFELIIPVSALRGNGVETLRQAMIERAPVGPHHYPEDWVTDIPQETFVSETIREKVMRLTHDEIPHQVRVDVTHLTEEPDGTFRISASIACTRENHKQILIGKGGRMIREIGTQARLELEEATGHPVILKTRVVVDKAWRRKKQQQG